MEGKAEEVLISENKIDSDLKRLRVDFVKTHTTRWEDKLKNDISFNLAITNEPDYASKYHLRTSARILANFEFGVRLRLEEAGYDEGQIETFVENDIVLLDKYPGEGAHAEQVFYVPGNIPQNEIPDNEKKLIAESAGKICVLLDNLLSEAGTADMSVHTMSGSQLEYDAFNQYLLIGVEEASHHILFSTQPYKDINQSTLFHLTEKDERELSKMFAMSPVDIDWRHTPKHKRKFTKGLEDESLIGEEGTEYNYDEVEYDGVKHRKNVADKLGINNDFEGLIVVMDELRKRSGQNLKQWE